MLPDSPPANIADNMVHQSGQSGRPGAPHPNSAIPLFRDIVKSFFKLSLPAKILMGVGLTACTGAAIALYIVLPYLSIPVTLIVGLALKGGMIGGATAIAAPLLIRFMRGCCCGCCGIPDPSRNYSFDESEFESDADQSVVGIVPLTDQSGSGDTVHD
jgi:hypothetical protein